jgi:hypothetical protein
MAQKQDSVPARSLAEKGAQGDIILEKKTKKVNFDPPQILQVGDSSGKREVHSKKAKNKTK